MSGIATQSDARCPVYKEEIVDTAHKHKLMKSAPRKAHKNIETHPKSNTAGSACALERDAKLAHVTAQSKAPSHELRATQSDIFSRDARERANQLHLAVGWFSKPFLDNAHVLMFPSSVKVKSVSM